MMEGVKTRRKSLVKRGKNREIDILDQLDKIKLNLGRDGCSPHLYIMLVWPACAYAVCFLFNRIICNNVWHTGLD